MDQSRIATCESEIALCPDPEGVPSMPSAGMQVIGVVSKCGENPTASVQLAVLRALLTCSTADHFVAHGDALMQRCGLRRVRKGASHAGSDMRRHR